jgi:hypothetical protein
LVRVREALALQAHKKGSRVARGSSLSEFAPALFLIFILGLLPTIDALCIGIDYASAFYLNELQLREAQKLPKSKAKALSGPVIATIPSQWMDSMLGGLYNPDETLVTLVTYQPVPWKPASGGSANFWFVVVQTTVSFRPFMAIPFFKGVPGLGSPFTITVTGRRPVETTRFLDT